MNIHNLFPAPVAFFFLGRDIEQTEFDFIDSQVKRNNEGNLTSADRYILRHKELTEIRNFIEISVLEYFNTVYAPQADVSVYITQSWVNYTNVDQYHHKHSHQNSFISGVFYPKADRGIDKIHFYKDGYEQITLASSNWNSWNSRSWWFDVGSGDLVLFPSHLPHAVQRKTDGDTRISLSFNTFIKGLAGTEEELTALHL
jgi:uncharacterized protein (TIGR02466 family)